MLIAGHDGLLVAYVHVVSLATLAHAVDDLSWMMQVCKYNRICDACMDSSTFGVIHTTIAHDD